MKKLLILFFIFSITGVIFSQTNDDYLNGKIFRGTATEITPPDVDRRPIFYEELIRFENETIISEVLKIYSACECKYTSSYDERRMVAVKSVEFISNTTGRVDGRTVEIEYQGNIYGDAKLSGVITIKYPDGNEIKFTVDATAE
ncbi:MAG: hypothetical protein M3R36_06990 [Bacteroidota bacterium]|nr:hypothetical protein [Bacteroidota bacterium]